MTTDLRLDRFHRYADFTRPGSFGPGVFSNLDIQMSLWNHGEAGELWDPSASSPIPLTRVASGQYADRKRSAIQSLTLLGADGSTVADADTAVTAVATQHDGTRWIFELVQAGLGGDADRQGRLTAIRDRVGNQLTVVYAFPASATDAELGGARARLLEMASVTDQRGRTLSFVYGWTCGQPVVTQLTYPTGEHVVYHYDGDIAGVCKIDYPDGTQSTFGLRDDPATQCMVVDYLDAGADGTHRTKSVYLTKTAFTQADGTVVAQSPNRVRRVVGPTGEPTYLNWLERNGSQVKIYVYEGGGIGGKGRVYRLDTTEGVTNATYVATSWSLATTPATWTWEKVADYQADSLFRMGQQVDPLGQTTHYDRDPVSGAITGRTRRDASGTIVSQEATTYNTRRQPTWHRDANGLITRSTYDEKGNLRFRTEGIVLAEDGVTEDASKAQTSEWQYRSDGQVLYEVDPLGRRIDYEYDAHGFQVAEVSPPDDPDHPDVRARKTWHYDAAGRLDRSADAAGHTTTYVYDSRNRVVQLRYGNNSTETFTYGTGADANLLLAKTDRDGMRTTFAYDAAGREISRTEGAQDPTVAITTTTSYVEGTDLPATVVRGNQRTDTLYDTRKRVIETRRWVDVSHYLAETTVYDAADRVAYTADAYGRRTYSVYDAQDRVVRTVRESVAGAVPAGADLAALPSLTTDNPAYVIDETAYDVGGRVLATTDPCGNVTRLAYDALGRLTDRWEASGTGDEGHWAWTYDAVGNRLTETDPLGHVTAWTYTGRNLMATQTVALGTPDAATTAYTYTLTGQRASQTDPNGHKTQWTYGSCCDWLEQVVDPAGFVTRYSYTPGGLVTTVCDASGHITTTAYDGRHRAMSVTNGANKTTVTTWDENLTDGRGVDAIYASQLSALVSRAGLQAVSVTDPCGAARVQVTDGLGRPVLNLDAMGYATLTTHDVQQVQDGAALVGVTVRDPLGNTTGRYADALGRVRLIQLPSVVTKPTVGTTTDTNLLDGSGIDAVYNLGGYGDLLNAVATQTVDAAGLTTVTVVQVEVRTSTSIGPFGGAGGDGETHWLDDGNLSDGVGIDADYGADLDAAGYADRTGLTAEGMIDGDGWVTLTIYQTTYASFVLGPFEPASLAGQIAIAYDANGNRRSTTDALGHTQSSTYDARNRQVGATDASGQTTAVAYDALGNVLRQVDARRVATEFTYTARNQKKTEKDRLGNTTVFSYDPVGNLLAISDAENEAKKATVAPEVYEAGKTRYTWDERNLLATQTLPGPTGGVVAFGYWPNGQEKTRTDQRGIVRTSVYDAANRLTDRTYSDGTADHFVLDDAGRVTSATASRSGVVVTRDYYPTGLIKSETTTWPAGISGSPTSAKVDYAYDAANRATTLTLPDGRTLDRTFTARNEMESLTIGGQAIATLGYDNAGRRTSALYGNGLLDSRGFTDNNLLKTTVVGPAAAPLLSLEYAYDANRRKTSETDNRDGALSVSMGYDDADRLTSWTTGGSPKLPTSRTWDLSAVGDWTKTTIDGVIENREHTPVHEVKTRNGTAVSYDAAGNLIRTAAGQGFLWDAENRLLAADTIPNADGAADRATYTYDALGRRVSKTVFGTTTRYVYDGFRVIQEVDAPTVLPASAAADDGSLATLAHTPNGALIASDPDSTHAQPIRVNFQPLTTPIPSGWLADKGKDYAVRSNTLTYGWVEGGHPDGEIRHFMPLPQYDTLAQLGDPGAGWSWQIALPNGSYPVAVVCGDATSIAHTNNITINGQSFEDETPGNADSIPDYNGGNFDLFTVQANVSNGVLTIATDAGAYQPQICFVEIGVQGTTFSADDFLAMKAKVDAATARTGGSPFWNGNKPETRNYVWGSGIDELMAYQRINDAGTNVYYIHTNQQWSVMAVTNESGQVVERFQYTATGKRASDFAGANGRSLSGLTTGFTGRNHDEATGTIYFRNREWEPDYQFIGRDPAGYVDGMSLYRGYFVPGAMDPDGRLVVFVHGIAESQHRRNGPAMYRGMTESMGWNRNTAMIHFLYGPAGIWDPLGGGEGQLNRHAATALRTYIDRLKRVREENCMTEPISIYAYSNGTMVTDLALRAGMQVDGVVFTGSPIARDTDMSASTRNASWIVNFYSNGDLVNAVTQGAGRYGFQENGETVDRPGLTNVYVSRVGHTGTDANMESWGLVDDETQWDSRYMGRSFYGSLLSSSINDLSDHVVANAATFGAQASGVGRYYFHESGVTQ